MSARSIPLQCRGSCLAGPDPAPGAELGAVALEGQPSDTKGPHPGPAATTLYCGPAFDLALRRCLIRATGPGTVRSVRAQHPASRSARVLPVAVVTCAWRRRAQAPAAASTQLPEVLATCLRACLQAWAQRVPGSFCGQTAQGVGLLLVPAFGLAHDTAQALDALLRSTARAAGAFDGDWEVRVIGPLEHGTADHVRRQLAQAGWPLS